MANGTAILDLLTELHQGRTTIALITHDHDVAARVPRQIRILDGRLVSDSSWETAGREPT